MQDVTVQAPVRQVVLGHGPPLTDERAADLVQQVQLPHRHRDCAAAATLGLAPSPPDAAQEGRIETFGHLPLPLAPTDGPCLEGVPRRHRVARVRWRRRAPPPRRLEPRQPFPHDEAERGRLASPPEHRSSEGAHPAPRLVPPPPDVVHVPPPQPKRASAQLGRHTQRQ
eukprot:scaffold15700_cov81-Isochrysis_galbana.AAC.4